MFTLLDDVESYVYCTGFCCEGRAFLRIDLFKIAVHAVLLLSLEPSVKTHRLSGWCWRIL